MCFMNSFFASKHSEILEQDEMYMYDLYNCLEKLSEALKRCIQVLIQVHID